MSELSIPAAQAKRNTTSKHHADSVRSAANPLQTSVRIYKPEELDHEGLATRTKTILGKVAFAWQLEIGAVAMCGEDVIVDVGTGCGKSLGFSIPLVLHETDIALRVTPLTALMVDQVCTGVVTIQCE
jgi:DEAD/DEAH box helicase